MYNLRYHIASLVSVFLALSLGLVLGGLIVQRGTFSGQPEALVDSLREEFADLRAENEELTAENELQSAFSAAITDDWIEGRLAKRVVFVLTNAGRNDGLTAASAAIEDAGGIPVVVTMRTARFGAGDEKLGSTIESLTAGVEKPEESIAASLAAEWTDPSGERPMTDALVEAGAITIEGTDAIEGAEGQDAIAVAGGFVNVDAPEGAADNAGIALQAALAEQGVPTLAAQSAAASSELAATVAERELAAIDTLGTDVGRYSLVALLTGVEAGYYGTAADAQALFPPFSAEPVKPAP